MFSGQAVFPALTGANMSSNGYTFNSGSGITIDALVTIVAMHALMSNPHYAPYTYQEMAQKAREISQALLPVL